MQCSLATCSSVLISHIVPNGLLRFLLPVRLQFLLSSALCHEAVCLDVVSNFFCSPAFYRRLRLHWIPLQYQPNTSDVDTTEKVATSHTSSSAAKTIKNQLKVTFRTADCQQYRTHAASTSFSLRCIVANNKNVVGKRKRLGGRLLVSCEGVWECKWMVHLTYSPNKLACHCSEPLIAPQP